MRLTAVKMHKLVAWVNIGAAIAWAFSSILVITIACTPAGPFTELEGQCSGLFSRWIYVAAVDIATEVAIFGLSIYLVAGLKMALKLKATVVMAFAVRLPVVAIAAIRLHYLHDEVYSDDPTLVGYNAAIWTQAEVAYSLLATAAACLGPFLRPFTRPYLAETRYQGSRGRTMPEGYDLSKVSNSKSSNKHSDSSRSGGRRGPAGHRKQKSAQSDYSDSEARLRPDMVSHASHVSHSRQSLDSHDSKRMIITKNMDWKVEYEGEGSMSRRNESVESSSA
jgi:hypothetical protein